MPVLRFSASADTTITNARREWLNSSGSLANMGAADSLQVFSVYNETGFNTSSFENSISRILIKFNHADIVSSTNIPPNAEIRLRLFNVAHEESVPRNYTLTVHPLTKSWTEGDGLDLNNFMDLGAANWYSASDNVLWENLGGDFSLTGSFSQSFEKGIEDLNIDISSLYALWKSGTVINNGLLIKLAGHNEDYLSTSYYKKMFSARGSQYFYNRPCLEARWSDVLFDDRNNAYYSSALAPADDNLNTLIFFNKIRGQLKNIPIIEATGSIYLRLFSGTIDTSSIIVTYATGAWVATGTYSAQFYTTHTGTLYDAWYHHDNSTLLYTGTINESLGRLKSFNDDYFDYSDKFILGMPNLQSRYKQNDNPKLMLFIRKKDWQANVFDTSNEDSETEYIKKAYYRIKRPIDNRIVVDFGTGSVEYTRLSYDKNGNYFNLDMRILEEGYQYELEYMFDIEGQQIIQPQTFKFRVE